MKKIVCESGSERVEFSYSDPLWLEDVSGITESDFVVNTEPLVDASGETYYGSSMGKREITITANIFDNYVARREQLLSFFQRGKLGTLYFYEDNMSGKKINYYPEKVSFDAIGVVRGVTVSVICPYPLFSDLLPTEISMAYWKPLIRFPFTVPGYSGTGNPLTFSGAGCKDVLEMLRVSGKTNYVPSAPNSPSPDYPASISGVTKVTVNGTDYALPQTLYSLPDGTNDNYDVISGTGIQNIGKVVLDGSDNWDVRTDVQSIIGSSYTCFQHLSYVSGYTQSGDTNIYCDRFKAGAAYTPGLGEYLRITAASTYGETIVIANSRLTDWSDSWTNTQKTAAFKAWLSSNPVTVLYQRAALVTISGTPQTIPVIPGDNVISADSGCVTVRCLGVFKVGERIKQQLSIVENQSNTQLGLTITFTASGPVSRPAFKNLTSGKQFRLNVSMSAGDEIVVMTGVGVKNAIQTADGDTRYVWSFGDDWVQMEPGHNELWYGADSGEDYLDVKYSYVQEYWGA